MFLPRYVKHQVSIKIEIFRIDLAMKCGLLFMVFYQKWLGDNFDIHVHISTCF